MLQANDTAVASMANPIDSIESSTKVIGYHFTIQDANFKVAAVPVTVIKSLVFIAPHGSMDSSVEGGDMKLEGLEQALRDDMLLRIEDGGDLICFGLQYRDQRITLRGCWPDYLPPENPERPMEPWYTPCREYYLHTPAFEVGLSSMNNHWLPREPDRSRLWHLLHRRQHSSPGEEWVERTNSVVKLEFWVRNGNALELIWDDGIFKVRVIAAQLDQPVLLGTVTAPTLAEALDEVASCMEIR